MQARFMLIEEELLPAHLSDYCLLTTAEIITTCEGASMETLRQRALNREYVSEDFYQKFSTRRDLESFVASEGFKLGLFLEVLYYVVSIVDFLFQLRKDGDFYFEVREELQPRLYNALVDLFAFGKEQIREVEDALVNRAEDYCADLATSGGVLLSYIRDWGTPEWRLILSDTAYFYVMVVCARAFAHTLINRAGVKGDFEIRCITCSEALRGRVRGSPSPITCSKCKTTFEIESLH
jgi:hypothetical protein